MVTRCFEVLQTATALRLTKQAARELYGEPVIKICFFYSSKVVTNYSMWMGNTLMSTPNSKTRGWSSLAGLGQPRRFFFFLLSLCSPSRGSWMCFMSSYSSAKSHISRSVSVTAFSPRIFFMIWRHLRNGGVAKSIAPKITWWLGGWSRDAGSEV